MDDELNKLLDEVPDDFGGRLIDLVTLTDAFCDKHLNSEYKMLCRDLAVLLCQKGSPAAKGKAKSWAAGIVYVLGRVNFLTDPDQPPHLKSKQIAEGFEVSVATMQAKARIIRNGIHLMPMDPDWTLPSRLDDNPLVWMLEVNGIIMDIRDAPRDAQAVAFEEGLIPYIPADHQADKEVCVTRSKQLYELDVALFSGPVTEAFAKKNPLVARTIQICSDQTLEDLHQAIFNAFDRIDEHLYEFQVGGRHPMDPEARRYGLPMAMGGVFDDDKPAGDVTRTTIGELELEVDEPFGYWFDFGDDWWHQVTVLAMHDEVPRGRYPKVTQKTGDSPPQYVDCDEDSDDD